MTAVALVSDPFIGKRQPETPVIGSLFDHRMARGTIIRNGSEVIYPLQPLTQPLMVLYTLGDMLQGFGI